MKINFVACSISNIRCSSIGISIFLNLIEVIRQTNDHICNNRKNIIIVITVFWGGFGHWSVKAICLAKMEHIDCTTYRFSQLEWWAINFTNFKILAFLVEKAKRIVRLIIYKYLNFQMLIESTPNVVNVCQLPAI